MNSRPSWSDRGAGELSEWKTQVFFFFTECHVVANIVVVIFVIVVKALLFENCFFLVGMLDMNVAVLVFG